jgi:MFS family permease
MCVLYLKIAQNPDEMSIYNQITIMNHNILISYLLSGFRYAWFWLGVWVLYYLRYTNYAGIGIMEMVMITSSVLWEIPTGAFADLIGKKYTLMLGFLFFAFGNFYMGAAPNFVHLMISVGFMTLGGALYSGTFEAFTYDTLVEIKQEDQFQKILANQKTWQLITLTFASSIGGFLYLVHPALPFYALGVILLIGSVCCLFLKEPKVKHAPFTLANYFKQMTQGTQELFRSSKVRNLTLLFVSISMIYVILLEQLDDIILVDFGFSGAQMGIILAILNLVLAIVSQLIPRLKKKFSPINGFLFAGGIFALTLLGNSIVIWYLAPLLTIMRCSIIVFSDLISSDELNQQISSENRSTSLSVYELLKKLPYVLLAYPIGAFADVFSPKVLAFTLGMVLVVILIFNKLFTQPKLSQRSAV